MSIRLGERAIQSVTAILKSDLAAELVLIDAERADGLTTEAPIDAHYYNYPKGQIAGDRIHVEVFEETITMIDRYTDARQARFTYTADINVRLHYFNRKHYSREDMAKLMRRYTTGVSNVIAKNNQLDGAFEIELATVREVVPFWEVDEEERPKVEMWRAMVTVEVKVEEQQ